MAVEYSIQCGLLGCGKNINVTKQEHERGYPDDCPHCQGAIWPMEEGHTGNDPSDTNEFARTHNRDGTKKH